MALEFGLHLEKVYVLYVWRLIFYICSVFKTQSPLKSMQNFSISRTTGSRDEPCKVTGTWGVVIWIRCSCPGEFKISRQVLVCSWGYCSIVHRAGESGQKRSSIAPSLGHASLWSLRTGHIQDLWGWPEASPEVANPTTDPPVGSWHFSLGRCFQDELVPWLVDMNKLSWMVKSYWPNSAPPFLKEEGLFEHQQGSTHSNTLATSCTELIHWKRPWCWERLRSGGGGQQRMTWLDGIDSVDSMSLSKFQGMVKDREVWHVVVHGVEKSQTQLSDWTTTRLQHAASQCGFDTINAGFRFLGFRFWLCHYLWRSFLNSLFLSFHICKWILPISNHLIGWLWGMIEIIHINHLAESLA